MSKYKNTKKKSKSGVQIIIGLKGIALGSIFVLCAIIWSFILGVIIGRGYGPIDLISPIEKKINLSSNSTLKKQNNKTNEKVLNSTELTFYQKIKQDTAEKLLNLQPYSKKKRKTSTTKVAKKTKTKSSLYEYIIQISSFSSKKDALSQLKLLQKKHLTAKIETSKRGSKTWYRVFIILRGSLKSIGKELSALKKLGFKDYIIKEKRKM